MRFLTRTLTGVFLTALTLGLLALAAGSLWRAGTAGPEAGGDRPGTARERTYTVAVDTLTPGAATPVITAYGEVRSRRTVEIRAARGGRVAEVAPAFRDGGRVAAGEVLVRLDPADARAAVQTARADLAQAQAERREAETRLELARADLAAARRTRDLRADALARQRDLAARGATAGSAVDDAEIALASAEQAVVSRRQALAQAEAALELAGIAVERRRIALAEAERRLADTTIAAPFDGLVSEAALTPGAVVSANERLGTLIDPEALEVAVRLTAAEFARLTAGDTALADIAVTATLPLPGFPVTVTGRLDRAAPVVGAGQTGRRVYAALSEAGAAALRPGDFLTVQLQEPALRNVSVIPAAAADAEGRILLVTADDRLEAAEVEILRRQGDSLIVAGALAGRRYVRERIPQLGPGVKVAPVPPAAGPEARAGADAPAATRLAGAGAADTLSLAPERRARLIAYVEGSDAWPPEVKTRLIAQLGAEEVPADVIARLERRMGG